MEGVEMLSHREWSALLCVSPAIYGCAAFFWLGRGGGKTPGMLRLKFLTMGLLISLFLILPFSLLPVIQSFPVTALISGILYYLVSSTIYG
eukprot:1233254-Rhodomonas_salina.1